MFTNSELPSRARLISDDFNKPIMAQNVISGTFELRCRNFPVYFLAMFDHREPTQSVWVADCYFIVNVLDLPFASPIAIYR